MALKSTAEFVGANEDFTETHEPSYRSATPASDVRAMLEADMPIMVARHAERVRSSSADLLERHGSPLFVVVHDDKIVAICHSEDEAHDLGEDSYRFEEFTVHGLSTEPKQIVGLTRR